MVAAIDGRERRQRSGTAALDPVEHLTLQERIYRELKTAVMAGRFAPGQTLTIKSLADAFGTSAMPVRESVRRLSAEGALEVLPNRSVRLPVLTRVRFDDLWSVRALVEGEAAGLAAYRRSPADLREIGACDARLARSLAAGQAEAMVRDNQAFHFAVYRASGSATLLPIIESLWLQSGPPLAYGFAHGTPMRGAITDSTRHHHADIVAALEAGDAGAAQAAMAADIRAAAGIFRAHYDFAPDMPA